MHSILVANIPLEVSNTTLMKFLQLNSVAVKHIRSFPDDYHHVNEEAQTKTLQVYTATEEKKLQISKLFSSPHTVEKMLELEKMISCEANQPTIGTNRINNICLVKKLSVTIL